MPSQQSIVKSLVWAVKTQSGKLSNVGIKAEKLIEVNRNKANLSTRSQQQSIFDRSINRAEYHDEKLMILRRHKGLIRELLGEAEYSEILHMTIKEKKQTRLEILSRPKAPKILQELLSNFEELLSPRPTKLLKDSKRFQRNPKESKRFQKISKDSKIFQNIP